jgi:hypothetical protein
MFGEHIEEMGRAFRESGTPVTAHDIAMAVADVAYAQGLIDEAELDLAVMQIEDEARYILELD